MDEKVDQAPVETPAEVGASAEQGTQTTKNSAPPRKGLIFAGAGILLIFLAGGAYAFFGRHKSDAPTSTPTPQQSQASQTSPSPTASSEVAHPGGNQMANGQLTIAQIGQNLSHGYCTGTGSKSLGSAPMNLADIGLIEPYGVMVGAHVTPIDHEYFYQTNQSAPINTYNVLAPADGTIVEITTRTATVGSPAKDITQYRIVISYSCTFFSYVDLATGLDPAITAALPSTWSSQGNSGVDIPVKQGQTIAKVGDESLDYAVWDLSKELTGFLVPIAYEDAEPWKPFTASPMNYYSDAVKAELTPKYTRIATPIDGKIDQDIEGKLAGTWFQVDTNGYLGSTDPGKPGSYWAGHLSFAHDPLDPNSLVISMGTYNGAQVGYQFAIKGNTPDPASVDLTSGLIKYELTQIQYKDANGKAWIGTNNPALPITINPNSPSQGVALVQMTAAHTLKFETFPGKTAAQVSGFDAKAVIYNRGDGSVIPTSTTATNP